MARPKLPRKSTTVDMTAMCDVAFLLLAFFILTTKFKPDEAVTINTPSSVASKVAPDKDVVLVSIDKDNKVYLSIEDRDKKLALAEVIKTTKGINLDKDAFASLDIIAVPFNQLAAYVALPKSDRNRVANFPGIPVDTSKGASDELIDWMSMINTAYQGQKMNLLLKGDNISTYPAFAGVLKAFKKNDFLKFQMVTNPQNVPAGTELWAENSAMTKSENSGKK
ncbi:MAG: biopolymer transporter ExbD [Phycisphaerales bacterium]|nr:biopolymer transporter ExbD [Phycisphaerales bacterium]